MKKINAISVFFPAYNEEKNIKKTVLSSYNKLKKIADRFEIIVVNDGSKDKTLEIVRGLEKFDKRIKLINHKHNKGYGGALKTGFYNCRYEWIFFMDSDGQFNFSEIDKLIDVQKKTKSDLVIGSYLSRKVSFFRRLNTFLWQSLVYLVFGLNVKDIDCAFKLINKKVIDSIPVLESGRGAFISTEFLVKAKLGGFKISEVPVQHFERSDGVSTGADLKVILNSFKDLMMLRRKLK